MLLGKDVEVCLVSSPLTFKGIALFTPAGDLVYCIDRNKQSQWHIHLCIALQRIFNLAEPPHFLVPCYTATVDLWFNPSTQKIEVFAEVHPLVLRHQSVLNAVFGLEAISWKVAISMEGACEPSVLSTYRAQFPQLWEERDLIVRLDYPTHDLSSQGSYHSVAQTSLTSPDAIKLLSSTDTQPPPELATTQGYVLRLFVSGQSPTTEKALTRLHQFLEESLDLPYTLKVIDVLKHPDLAEADQILATPTLLRVWPLPVRRLVGELDNLDRVIHVIGSI